MNLFFTKLFLLLHNLGIFIINMSSNSMYKSTINSRINFMLHGLDDLAAKRQKKYHSFLILVYSLFKYSMVYQQSITTQWKFI